MDEKLLRALSNIGDGLDELVKALKDKKGAKSDTATAVQAGDFSKQLTEIQVGLKSIKKDTQEILKGQKTILETAKAKEADKKTEAFETDPKKESMLKKGVGSILLIAVAVLAIGLAFKLVGKVDFLSVIGLGIAIVLIAKAFETVAMMKLSLKEASMAAGAVILISAAIMISSFFLAGVKTIGVGQLITSVLIGAAMMLILPSIGKMMESLKGLSLFQMMKSIILLPLILPAIALGIALASYSLGLVKPITLSNFIGAIMVGAIFVVLSFGLKKIIGAFDGLDPATAATASFLMPILFTGMSIAISLSSDYLSKVVPITFANFVSAVMISALFVVLAYAIKPIARAISKMDWKDIPKIPALFTIMSLAIAASAFILFQAQKYIAGLDFMTMLKILVFTIVMGLAVIALAAVSWAVNKLGKTSDYIKAGLSILIIAATISGASRILSEGKYEKYPSLKWIIFTAVGIAAFGLVSWLLMKIGTLSTYLKGSIVILAMAGVIVATSRILTVGKYENFPSLGWVMGVGASLLAFSLAAGILGLAVFGPQALIFAAGLAAILGVAGTITATSLILAKGKYDLKGFVGWAIGTATLFAVFVPAIIALGAIGLAGKALSLLGAGDPIENGKKALIGIADAIVAVSFRLATGTYGAGPTKAWAEGVGIAIGAFSPVYGMMMANGVMKIFGGGGVGPEEFAQAILVVSDGIIIAADKFASSSASFIKGPTKDWAEGVGLAIGAFAPVYTVLMKEKGLLGSGVSVKDMSTAIETISDGIITAAGKFQDNKAKFDLSGVPSREWGEGVGAALSAFTPVFSVLQGKSWYQSGKGAIKDLSNGIGSITDAMINVAKRIFWNRRFFSAKIDPNFMASLGKNIIGFVGISKYLDSVSKSGAGLNTSSLFGNDPISKTANGMIKIASAYDKLASSIKKFGNSLNSINVEKAEILRRLTGNMAILSALDSKMFDSMLGTLEKRASMFSSLLSSDQDVTKTAAVDGSGVKKGGPGQLSQVEKVGKHGNMQQQLDKVIDLLAALNASTSQLDEFLSSKGFTEPPKAPPELGSES